MTNIPDRPPEAGNSQGNSHRGSQDAVQASRGRNKKSAGRNAKTRSRVMDRGAQSPASARPTDARVRSILEAIRQKPADWCLYCMLARALPDSSPVALHDGRSLNRRELYVEALKYSDENPLLYRMLADELPGNASVHMPNGQRMTRQQLENKAKNLGDVFPFSYELHGREIVFYYCNDVFTGAWRQEIQKRLWIEAIAWNTLTFDSHLLLGNVLLESSAEDARVNLPAERTLSRKEMYSAALIQNEHNIIACLMLAPLLQDDEVFSVQGMPKTRQQLYLYAIELEPTNFIAYARLGSLLDYCVVIRMPDGQSLDKFDMYAQCIECGHRLAHAYTLVASLLQENETVLVNGRHMTQRDLLVTATGIDRQSPYPY
eukprot:TRINITY_DN18678_c0_g1::TRINITY_DN18678_c0_g1_i1::g.20459::m.20459 TRINITY_DN18678_c0_g1::TRINITY_DN18678_c0_g1_i1::g.20459  ORF type:complete len:374 (-),score=30.75,TPR_17/PF13431.1/28,TPR_17/PF13431.1/86,TPR_17/PF13431.1/4.3e+03,TPR_17/PF13431.1/1.2e+04,TPR_17/PF13431.1/0.016,TPR_17/PF13431.1/13,DUF2946/PF11162.3/0.16,TPR_11/PF13414.1/1.1e+03,TPR_11/PF13414.1/64,TPR_11/PF13414.1/43 TRINITY_DN18678_c0_g1_i1:173-1294(-)